MRTFSSRRCGLLFKSRLASEVVEAMRSFYRRGESIRLTAKHLGLNRGTVRRYFRLLAREDSSV
jgi:DNA invertase Pin-like site-specific DNA recombinase